MSREVHVRICGGLVVRFLRSTRATRFSLHKDLQDMKTLLQTRPAAAAAPAVPPSAVLSVAGAPFKGEPTVQLTRIECTDCP